VLCGVFYWLLCSTFLCVVHIIATINISVCIVVKHNKILFTSSVDAGRFGLIDYRIRNLKHKCVCIALLRHLRDLKYFYGFFKLM
jgi:hypothetical protein